MKKIILLISTLLLTGCYDYSELQNLAIVTAIGIDYNENYEVTFEIINTSSKTDTSLTYKEQTILISSTGDSFVEAYQNAKNKIEQLPYLYQLELLILSDQVAYKGIEDIFDYLLRETKINNLFYTILSKDITTKELLNNKTPNEPITSTRIIKYIEDNSGKTYERFDSMINTFLKEGIDISLLSIEINEEEFAMNHLGVFKEDKLVSYLSVENTRTFNLITNNFRELLLYKDKDAINLYDISSNISLEDETIVISLTSNATIKELDNQTDLRKPTIYDELTASYSNYLQEEITNLVETLKSYNSDPLGLEYILYLNRINKEDITYSVQTSIDVNKNGLLFEVIK